MFISIYAINNPAIAAASEPDNTSSKDADPAAAPNKEEVLKPA